MKYSWVAQPFLQPAPSTVKLSNQTLTANKYSCEKYEEIHPGIDPPLVMIFLGVPIGRSAPKAVKACMPTAFNHTLVLDTLSSHRG